MIRKIAATTALGVLLLTGCASTDGKADDDPPSGSNADTSETEPDTEESDDSSPGELAFGEAFTYEDGLTVKVSKPRSYTPSQSAAAKPGPAVAFTITLVNKTGKPFDGSLVYVTLQSGNREADEIFDSEKGIMGTPSTKLLDGRESKWDVAYNVKNPKDLVMEISPDAGIEYEAALYAT